MCAEHPGRRLSYCAVVLRDYHISGTRRRAEMQLEEADCDPPTSGDLRAVAAVKRPPRSPTDAPRPRLTATVFRRDHCHDPRAAKILAGTVVAARADNLCGVVVWRKVLRTRSVWNPVAFLGGIGVLVHR